MKRRVEDYKSSDFDSSLIINSNIEIQKVIAIQLRRISWATISYYSFLTFFFCGLLYNLYTDIVSSANVPDIILKLSLGVILGVVSIFIHEWLHGLGYRTTGATSIDYKFSFLPIRIYTSVHRYVISIKEYIWILLLPFFVILFLVTLLYLFTSISIILMFSFLIVHTWLCSGDFGLVNLVLDDSQEKSFVYYDSEFEILVFMKNK